MSDGTETTTGRKADPQYTDGSAHVDLNPPAVGIVQHDTNEISPPLTSIRCNAAGTLKLRSTSGDDFTLTVVAGELIHGSWDLVYATTTDIADADLMGYQRA